MLEGTSREGDMLVSDDRRRHEAMGPEGGAWTALGVFKLKERGFRRIVVGCFCFRLDKLSSE